MSLVRTLVVALSVLCSQLFVTDRAFAQVEKICLDHSDQRPPPPSPFAGFTPHVIGEGVIGVPGREMGWLVFVNIGSTPQVVGADFLLIGETECVLRTSRVVPPYARVELALHDDASFQAPLAFSVVVWFEGSGSAHLITRPADDLWRAETIVAGVRIGGAQ